MILLDRRFTIPFVLLLAACTPFAPFPHEEIVPSDGAQSSVSSSEPDVLPQVTPELSIDSFRSVPLVGTGFTLESVLARTTAYTRYAIGYSSNGLHISGILNVPAGDGPFPLVVLNHGYIAPSVYTRGRGLKREQDWLASRGFAVLHSDYRGHAESDPSPDVRNVYDAGLEYSMDIMNGIAALCASGQPIDCDDITMLGHSMGGGVTLNIAVAFPDRVDRIVLYAPVSGQAWKNFDRWRRERDDDDVTEEVLGTPESNPMSWAQLSSWTQLSAITVPVLIAHGGEDADVPKQWSDELFARLTDLGKDVRYLEFEAEKHEFINRWPQFMQAVEAFANGSVNAPR